MPTSILNILMINNLCIFIVHRSSVDRLDNQVSNLHQDVAVLSLEVRNAIQALQEMSTPSSTSHLASQRFPTHSNPNIQREFQTSSSSSYKKIPVLERSSSQPPDMFCWEDEDDRSNNDNHMSCLTTLIDVQTQTDDYIFQQFVRQNSKLVCQMLGAGPMCSSSNQLCDDVS